MRDLPGVVDDGLCFAVAKPLAALDNRIGELGANRMRILVIGDERALAQPRHAFLQRADAVAQNLRQHGNDKAGEIGAVASLLAFGIERCALFNEERDIGDVYAEFPVAILYLAKADRIVVVLGGSIVQMTSSLRS